MTFALDTASIVEGLPGLTISRLRDAIAHTDLVEGNLEWDNKVVGSDLGYFFNGVVS